MMSSSTRRCDAIIIGGGHNGLTTAAYLAKAGKQVLLLERRDILGGATVTEEIFPGFKYSVASYAVSLLRPEVIRDLDLPSRGLEIVPLESAFSPLPDGDHLVRYADPDMTRREIYRHSPHDADLYPEFGRLMSKVARAIKPIISMAPPDPTSLDPRELLALAKLGRYLTRDLEEKQLYSLIKLMTMSAADFLDEWFESDALKAVMSTSGLTGTFLGPRSPGTAYVMLHHYLGEIDGVFRAWGFARGGTGAIAEAIANAAREYGAEIRTDASVEEIIVKNGRAVGVALQGGEEIYARRVASSVDPRLTFHKMVGDSHLPTEFVDDVSRFKFNGSSGKVNLALSELPRFASLPEPGPHLRSFILVSPSMDYLERAYDDAKYGNFSQRPYLDVTIPTLFDPSMAPPGKHVMSIFVQWAPYHLNGGWNDAQREAFGDAVVNTLAEHVPNLKSSILHRQVLTPWDLEQIMGLTEGNIFQGELSLQQLFFLRPSVKWSNYRTPIRNLYLCGSGAHPGGGISSAPGRLAALEILKDWAKPWTG